MKVSATNRSGKRDPIRGLALAISRRVNEVKRQLDSVRGSGVYRSGVCFRHELTARQGQWGGVDIGDRRARLKSGRTVWTRTACGSLVELFAEDSDPIWRKTRGRESGGGLWLGKAAGGREHRRCSGIAQGCSLRATLGTRQARHQLQRSCGEQSKLRPLSLVFPTYCITSMAGIRRFTLHNRPQRVSVNHDMNSRRAITGRWFITLLLLAAWFGASNHCALGFMQGAHAIRQHAGCCGHPSSIPGAPAKNAPPVKECCGALQGTLPTPDKTLAVPIILDSGWQFAAPSPLSFSTLLELSEVDPIETGPPDNAPTFAELVLQRSLRSHAPPLAA